MITSGWNWPATSRRRPPASPLTRATTAIWVTWPAVPGATGYNVLSSSSSGSGYALLAANVIGPVCGSGSNNACFLDTTAVNGSTYFYAVQSLNPAGVSANSPPSPGATPSAAAPVNPPAAPAGLSATAGDRSVALSWNASLGASFYTIRRSTIVDDGVGTYVTLGTAMLNNALTATNYTDTTPTDGSTYSYFVTAVNAAGAEQQFNPRQRHAAAPAARCVPGPVDACHGARNEHHSRVGQAVSGAVGYIVQRAASPGGPYTFLMSVTETTYADNGLSFNSAYYYQVAAVNAAGVSANAAARHHHAPVRPPA